MRTMTELFFLSKEINKALDEQDEMLMCNYLEQELENMYRLIMLERAQHELLKYQERTMR